MSNTVRVAVPLGKVAEENLPLNPRPPRLEGAVIGFVENRKPGSDVLFKAIAECLKSEYQVAEIIYVQKPSSVVPVSDAAIRDLARSHAIICGVGD